MSFMWKRQLEDMLNLSLLKELKENLNFKGRKHLPLGTGPHTVGCVDFMSDHNVTGTFVRLYYPTKTQDVFKRQEQWPKWLPRKQYGKGYMYFRRKNPMKAWTKFFLWMGGDVYVPVLWQAPILQNGTRFPVIVFSHGLGGNRTVCTTICVDLASHGFIVAAVEHRDGSASMTYCLGNNQNNQNKNIDITCDGIRIDGLTSPQEQWLMYERQEPEDDYEVRNKQVYIRAEECRRVLDLMKELHSGQNSKNVLGLQWDHLQLKGTMDFSRVAVMGHSFGGATTIASLAKDQRFKVGIAFDTWMLPLDDDFYEGLKQPLLMINDETFQWEDNVLKMNHLRTNMVERLLITILGTCHQSQTDFQFIARNTAFAKVIGIRNELEPEEAMEINNKATLGFLRKHLNLSGDHHNEILYANHKHVIGGTNLNVDVPHYLGKPTEAF